MVEVLFRLDMNGKEIVARRRDLVEVDGGLHGRYGPAMPGRVAPIDANGEEPACRPRPSTILETSTRLR